MPALLNASTANTVPPEVLTQVFHLLSPRDFDNARRTCSQWMRASLDVRLLESMLKRAGWWERRKMNVEKSGFLTTSVVDFSQLSRERASDSRQLSSSSEDDDIPAASSFHVSNCGTHLLVVSGCTIQAYHLLDKRSGSSVPTSERDLEHSDISRVACITCPAEVLSATIDMNTSKLTVAALMHNRLGMICDLVPVHWRDEHPSTEIVYDKDSSTSACWGQPSSVYSMKMASRHFFYDVCSPQDPPHTLSICPGHRSVAFGCDSGIELRWVNEPTNKGHRKYFPMSQPSEILHFMPHQPDTPLEFRLISSLAGPGVEGCGCQNWPASELSSSCCFHTMENDVQTFSRRESEHQNRMRLVRTTRCHHYRAVPVNDGVHVLFVEPQSGFLCIGSDAPIDGPTSLMRALVCVPPFRNDTSDDAPLPTAFAAGTNLNWGLRVVAAYGDRLVFYSVPLDVFKVIKKERERQGAGVMADSDLARDFFVNHSRGHAGRGSSAQNQNGDWEFLLSISYRPTAMMWPFKIYGKEIGRVNNVVELALQSSHGGARIWAFGASGETSIIDVDTFTSASQQASDIPCKSFTIGADGRIASAQLVKRAEHSFVSPDAPRKQKTLSRAEFTSRYMLRHQRGPATLRGWDAVNNPFSNSGRRPSFAARIVDVKIPELESTLMDTEAVY
ncbi:hypothetical protein BJX99DRAFT_246629 [Aspergillus californicus]